MTRIFMLPSAAFLENLEILILFESKIAEGNFQNPRHPRHPRSPKTRVPTRVLTRVPQKPAFLPAFSPAFHNVFQLMRKRPLNQRSG
jgi:hypothetical protein